MLVDRTASDRTSARKRNFCTLIFYRKFQNELSWAGSNLNQSVKRANELAVAGLLSPGYVNEVLLPSIQDVQNILKRIKDDLETLNNRTRLIK